ncbi:MAG: isochorismatase family protein, partial [bacterium]|nr:isochorismatase family protein [bacterium]
MNCLRIAAALIVALLATSFATCTDPEEASRSALVIIDVQLFYYPGGAAALVEPEKASLNASKVLAAFRDQGDLVVHVRHKSSKGFEIHEHVAPIEGEKVFTKTEVSCFNG